jgi:putative DNA primase/helicase
LEEDIRSDLTQFAKEEFDRLSMEAQARGDEKLGTVRKVTVTVVGNAIQALRSLVRVSADSDPPFWIGGDGPVPADTLLVAKNGLISILTFVKGNRDILPLTPQLFTTTALDYDIDPEAKSPEAWIAFLHQLCPTDPESIDTLQEVFGYYLFADTRMQKIVLIVGPTRSGKGTIARVIAGVVGKDNVAGPTLAGLASQFGLSALLGKNVAIISDARLSNRADQGVIVERLLSISGEDMITVDRKFMTPLTCKLTTKLMILNNELPPFAEASGALANRMILLRLTESFLGKEDRNLTDKLLAERSSILLWAIQGWKRLYDRGHFIQPASGKELLQELEDLTSPVGAFVKECCQLGPGFQVRRQELFKAYQGWAKANGRNYIDHIATFAKNLRAVLPALGSAQKTDSGKKVRYYTGIALSGDGLFYSTTA